MLQHVNSPLSVCAAETATTTYESAQVRCSVRLQAYRSSESAELHHTTNHPSPYSMSTVSTSSFARTDAQSPFNQPSADITIRTSDHVDFHVHSQILSQASPVFATMFRASATQTTIAACSWCNCDSPRCRRSRGQYGTRHAPPSLLSRKESGVGFRGGHRVRAGGCTQV